MAPPTGQVHSPSTWTSRTPSDSSHRSSLLGLLGGGGRGRPRARHDRLGGGPELRRPIRRRARRRGSRRQRASRPCRITWTAHRPFSWRAATTSGHRVRAEGAGCGATPRRKDASRSRHELASSKRSSAASALIRAAKEATTASGRPTSVVPQLVDQSRVVLGADPLVAGREAPAHLGQRAGAEQRQLGHPATALPDREGLVQRGDGPLGGALRTERPDVVSAVVQHPTDQGQARPRLDGQLDPVGALGVAGAAVVAGLVLRDQPQLADLGLQRGRALDALAR